MTSTWKWTPLSYVSTADFVDFVSNAASLRSTALDFWPKRCGLVSTYRTRIYPSTRP